MTNANWRKKQCFISELARLSRTTFLRQNISFIFLSFIFYLHLDIFQLKLNSSLKICNWVGKSAKLIFDSNGIELFSTRGSTWFRSCKLSAETLASPDRLETSTNLDPRPKKLWENLENSTQKWQLHPPRLPPSLPTNTNRIGILTMKTGHLCLSWRILTKRTSKWPKLRPLILSLVKVGPNLLDHHPLAHPDPRVFTSLWKCLPPIHCHLTLS